MEHPYTSTMWKHWSSHQQGFFCFCYMSTVIIKKFLMGCASMRIFLNINLYFSEKASQHSLVMTLSSRGHYTGGFSKTCDLCQLTFWAKLEKQIWSPFSSLWSSFLASERQMLSAGIDAISKASGLWKLVNKVVLVYQTRCHLLQL